MDEEVDGIYTAFEMAEEELDESKLGIEWFQRFIIGLSKVESINHSYTPLGDKIEGGYHDGTRAFGRYQFMPKLWLKYLRNDLKDTKYEGKILAPTPQAVELVAFNSWKKNYIKEKKKLGIEGRVTEKDKAKLVKIFYLMATDWVGRNQSVYTNDYAQYVLEEMKLPETRPKETIKLRNDSWTKRQVKHILQEITKDLPDSIKYRE